MDVTIADLPQIQRTKTNLFNLHKTPPEQLLTETEELARFEIKSFISQLGLRDIYLPTRERGIARSHLKEMLFDQESQQSLF